MSSGQQYGGNSMMVGSLMQSFQVVNSFGLTKHLSVLHEREAEDCLPSQESEVKVPNQPEIADIEIDEFK